MYSMLMAVLFLRGCCFQGFYLSGTLGDQPVHIHLGQ
ncbi:hypothetical protein KPNIH2_26875, partial [Klebsiella pneumoniae subsp. pneumoniae KPNIH2]